MSNSHKKETVICQSCGMPMAAKEHFGTYSDGTMNGDYCCFCFNDGTLKLKNITFEEYVNFSIENFETSHLTKKFTRKLTRDELVLLETVHLQELKRWKAHQITHQEYYKSIYKIIEYIDNHLSEPIRLADLSKISNISEFHFRRIFKAVINENPYEYIQRLRLEKTAFKLQTTSYSLSEIAIQVGFQSMHSLSKAFKNRYNISPTVYRNNPIQFTIRDNNPILKLDLSPMIVTIFEKNVISTQVHNPFKNVHAFHQAWGLLCSYMQTNGLPNVDVEYLCIFYDVLPLTSMENYRIYACINTDSRTKASGKFFEKTIEGGLYAIFRHEG